MTATEFLQRVDRKITFVCGDIGKISNIALVIEREEIIGKISINIALGGISSA